MRADPVSDDDRDAEATLLRAARAGDELAFRSLVEPRLAELRAYCYRMLGSMHDADDVVQETLLRAWRGLARFEGRSTLRSWLYRIATNACLTALGRRSRRALPMDLSASSDADRPLDEARAEQIWLEPFTASVGLDARRAGPEARYELLESVELAFVAAVHELPPNERAALVLRDVLAFSAREVADLMVTSTAAVNSALQRARQRLDGRLPTSQQRVEQSMGDERVSTLVQRYMDAMRRADVDAVVALLTEDATWSMPPIPNWFQGHASIATFLIRAPFQSTWRHVATRASGQAAVAAYRWDAERSCYVATALDVLTLRGPAIASITAFLDGVHIARLGLPASLPADH